MKKLVEIQEKLKFNTDKHRMPGKHSKAHTYLPEYDRLFEKFKYEPINILEIGVLDGSSLNLWAEYFPNAKIYGVDLFKRISFKVVKNNTSKYDNISLHKVDSVNEEEKHGTKNGRKNLFEILGKEKFHIIIDDGDHKPTSQLKTFNNFIDELHPDGLYIIEDIWDWDKNSKGKKEKSQNTLQTGLEYLQENIPELEIIDMNNKFGIYRDNVLGVYNTKK
jgi:hypothetical protein